MENAEALQTLYKHYNSLETYVVCEKSGLTQKSRDSQISLGQAESELLQFVKRYTPASSCPLAGNSVHVDKVFLARYMPQFVQHLHYRIVDVSTIKELCR